VGEKEEGKTAESAGLGETFFTPLDKGQLS
jgi:hypothetical protein